MVDPAGCGMTQCPPGGLGLAFSVVFGTWIAKII
jgi:hypothetical protein